MIVVDTLTAGGDFQTTEQQVERQCKLGILCIVHCVERALCRGEVGDEDELRAVGLFCPLAHHNFLVGVEVITVLRPVSYTHLTHQRNYDIIVSARFLSPDDRVLLIDDFLAKGSAMLGLISLVRQSGATIVGAGICIEKGFDVGGKAIRDLGIDVQSLAVIKEMRDGHIVFDHDTAAD